MGVGPAYTIPRVLHLTGLTLDDISNVSHGGALEPSNLKPTTYVAGILDKRY